MATSTVDQLNLQPHAGVRVGRARGDGREFVQRRCEVGAPRRLGHQVQPPLRQEDRIGHPRRGMAMIVRGNCVLHAELKSSLCELAPYVLWSCGASNPFFQFT